MKKTLSVAALAVALTGSAFAADLPHYKAPLPPPPPPPPLWTGFYVGLNAGGTWASSRNTTITTFPVPGAIDVVGGTALAALTTSGILSTNSSGFIGGGQIGYNWQFFNGAAVAGIEADIQGVAASNSAATGFGIAPLVTVPGFTSLSILNASRRLDYVGTVRGRLGWLFTPTLLLYGTGGLAYGGVTSNISTFQTFVPGGGGVNPAFGAGQFSDTRVGWTAGGGLEWMFWPKWSAKVEYLYYDLGSLAYSASPAVLTAAIGTGAVFGTTFSQVSTRFNGHIVRAGVNYHFNWGAPPVVAKY